jgi:hypothetical protein
MSKEKNFGLAAQLARPRDSAPDTEQILPIEHSELVEREKHTNGLERVKHTETSEPPRKFKGGRPRRIGGIERLSLVLSTEMYEYVVESWRFHKTEAGKYVNGTSAFIEDLILRHSKQKSQ